MKIEMGESLMMTWVKHIKSVRLYKLTGCHQWSLGILIMKN
ncbi:MAG: hypothetical protein E6423_10895 [Clostridium sp.]|nr:hypothetical protein [Clostridium paraputrificum]MDU6809285.1 hypothetical protein [Clostridium sp.]